MFGFLAGLFVGEEEYEAIRDNLDLERWFRLPKSHERRIHGHRHAGIRLVLEGPTLVHVARRPRRASRPVQCRRSAALSDSPRAAVPNRARNRRTIMRKARSNKERPLLLAELERRYRESPGF